MGVVTNTTDKYQKCLDACAKCVQACYECFNACVNEPDADVTKNCTCSQSLILAPAAIPNATARKNCMSILLECALICQQAVAYMSMDAQYAKDLCKLCATICDKCAQDCEMFKDDHCQKCAQVCKTCATECRNMAGA
ncbi:MAG: four-helix bundle copper-binding protein [Syntrophomonadaceae bacterium]|nr:four-helix bundle copper-binding protein [Syntrophomonadaceae bacterium]MDD3889468.1 four-helix bundle copper-binding protein [Syntrophomonadaceae bacterium]MDD4549978.1 four-helix bundle copper-binding protein [Syntrophomonadaceae bacterium]